MSYVDKIKNHMRLELDDITEFVNDQIMALNLQQYIDTIKIKNVFAGVAAYSFDDSSIYIDENINESFKKYRNKCFKSNLLALLSCNNVDLYNLYIINTIYHEIWHAKQQQQINENMNNEHSQLLDVSLKLMQRSGSTYNSYHDKYFHESDAIINSIKLTLAFSKKFNFQREALVTINKSFADEILNCFLKIRSTQIVDVESHNEYSSPVLATKALGKYLLDNDWNSNCEHIIDSYIYKYMTDNDLTNLLNCVQISDPFLDTLIEIKNGKDKTIDIIEFLGAENKKRKQF